MCHSWYFVLFIWIYIFIKSNPSTCCYCCCFGCHQVYNRFHAAATRKQYYDYLFISNRKTYRFVLCFVKTQNHIWCKSNNTLRSHGRETMHTNISTYNRQWNVTNDDDKMLEVQRDHTFFQWSGSKPTSTTTYINIKMISVFREKNGEVSYH